MSTRRSSEPHSGSMPGAESPGGGGEALDGLLVRVGNVHSHAFGLSRYEPLGLLYLASFAVRKGYEVRVCSYSASVWRRLRNRVAAARPKVVGFYCDHDNMSSVCRISILLREEFPGLILLVGGPQAKFAEEEVMRAGRFDALVRGEGERALGELLDHFVRGAGEIGSIQGVTYWSDDELVRTPDRPHDADLDGLPIPDRSLSEGHAVPRGDERIMSGRGCPYRCAFCAEGVSGAGAYRYRSPESVLEEVDYLLGKRALRYLLFTDDTFIAKPSRALEIAEGLRERRLAGADFVWYCEARVDILARHPELLPAMREAGLARVQIGIESGNQEILDAYGKGTTLDQVRCAVRQAVEAGVPSVVGNFIIGGAHETKESIERSTDFAQELIESAPGRIDLSTTFLTPYPGTRIRERPEEFGIRIIDPDCLTGEDDSYCFVETSGLGKWEILDAHEMFVAVRKAAMFQMLEENRIPDHLILEHHRLLDRYDLLTEWTQIYLSIGYLSNYFGLLIGDDCRRLAEIPPDELLAWHPVRTYRIAASRNGLLVIDTLGRIQEFDALGTAIYELCSGRAPLARICGVIKERFFPDRPDGHVRALVIAFLAQLEDQRLLVWSKI